MATGKLQLAAPFHVFSDRGNEKQKVNDNKFLLDNSSKFNGTYTSEDGTKVFFGLDIKYVEGEEVTRREKYKVLLQATIH